MHFKTLFFDLDDTLYPAKSGLWEAIRHRMNQYMQRIVDLPISEIVKLRQLYLENYGTTLRGLQAHYLVDADDYLAFVHDLPLEKYIQPDPNLRTMLLTLPQRRWIFTNSDSNHAKRVLRIIGIEDCFEGIIDIRALGFECKPDIIAYKKALAIAGVDTSGSYAIFDDSLRNLLPARDLGFFTVLVGQNGSEPHVDLSINSLHALKDVIPELWRNEV